MRKRCFYIIFFLLYIITAGNDLYAYIPEIKYPVNDRARIITTADEQKITKLLIDHKMKTGVHIAVLTVRSTGKMSIEEYSMQVAEKWAGGSKERDDGLLFLIDVNNRRMRLEVGYGLEGYLPDITARAILDSIKPDFKKYAYGKGIYKVIKQVIIETDSLRADENIPLTSRGLGFIYKIISLYTLIFLLGVILCGGLVLLKVKVNMHKLIYILLSLILWIAVPVLLYFYYRGVWVWNPFVYVTGTISGYSLGYGWIVRQKLPNRKSNKPAHFGFIATLIPAIICFLLILICIDIISPNAYGTSSNETVAFFVLIFVNIIQFVIGGVELMTLTEINMGVYKGKVSFGGSSSYNYSSSNSSSSSSSSYSSGSSGSSSSSWSGGGGSFGGGGASSSW